jgi:O-antigen/teichoic acid export membrane protein
VARILNAQDFGIYAVVLSTGQIATLIAGAGMGFTVTEYVAEFSEVDPRRASRVFGLCLAFTAITATIMGISIAFTSPFMAEHFSVAKSLATPFWSAGGICVVMTLNAVMTGALAGIGEYRALCFAGLTSGILYMGITITAAW